jgi:subtilisin family serine protease
MMRGLFALLVGEICAQMLMGQAVAQTYRQDRILIKPSVANIDALHTQLGTRVLRRYPQIGNIQVVQLPAGTTVPQAIAQFQNSGQVAYAEPDYIVHAVVTNPNDPKFADGTLWGLRNTGQNGGTADADIDAPEGWDHLTTANSVIVAVTDSGVRYTHQDLAANIWTNPGEIAGNGIDDDGDGYVDDVYGINAITGSGDLSDDFGHGTHVSGIIGAVGNNGTGVVGVAWGVKIMALKFLDSSGNGSASDGIECISYATSKRANIINASWGASTDLGQGLREAIAAARNQGILFVAAAGNTLQIGGDNDSSPFYPASYDLDNIISVAATTRTDARASYSHWGLVSVHVGAPGGEPSPISDGIYSTWNTSDSAYQYEAGTSMATPHVVGTLALMKAYDPADAYVQLKNRLLSSTDPIASLAGRCQTGGRLNLNAALNTVFWQPRNDNFANALSIAKPSSATSITFVANNVDATKQTGEPNHAGNAGGKSVWWNWTAPNNNSVTFTTKGSGFDTLLAVYTGSSVSSLALVASDNNSGQCGTSQVTFTPVSGTTYRIAVDGFNGSQGIIKLNLQNDSSAQPTALMFTLSSVQRSSGQFHVTVTGPASATVTIDTSSDFTTWTSPYAQFALNSSGTYAFTDAAASPSVRFYRASIISSSQQSCNVVGYADVSGTPLKMIANPFNAVDNRIIALMPAPPDPTTIFKYNPAISNYTQLVYQEGAWGGDDLNMTLAPGEGVLIDTAGVNWTMTFVGQVAQGYGVNPVDNAFSIRSSIVPQPGRVHTDLGLPVIDWATPSRVTLTAPALPTPTAMARGHHRSRAWPLANPLGTIRTWVSGGTGTSWSGLDYPLTSFKKKSTGRRPARLSRADSLQNCKLDSFCCMRTTLTSLSLALTLSAPCFSTLGEEPVYFLVASLLRGLGFVRAATFQTDGYRPRTLSGFTRALSPHG